MSRCARRRAGSRAGGHPADIGVTPTTRWAQGVAGAAATPRFAAGVCPRWVLGAPDVTYARGDREARALRFVGNRLWADAKRRFRALNRRGTDSTIHVAH